MSYEIIVVDDGAHDCEQLLSGLPVGPGGSVRVVTLDVNRGKGGAVAAGMSHARGEVRVFTDIDVPYGAEPVLLIERLIRTRGFHVVIGDRTFPQSRYETELPLGRRVASSVFSFITATLVTGGFFDTQCGLKGFRHGDAQISHMHANIMLNLGHATARDVRELITIAQSAVAERFDQHLEPEIGFIGEF